MPFYRTFRRVYKNRTAQLRYRYGTHFRYRVRKFRNMAQRTRYYANPSKFKRVIKKRYIRRKYLY